MDEPGGGGRLEAIWIKRARGAPMDPVERAVLDDAGLVGNANRGGRRQVTVIEREVFERIEAELGRAVDPAMRRANLMVSGVRLEGSRGAVLHVGACRIRVGGETRPCNRMDEAHPGLQAGLDPEWSGGCYGVVEAGGEIRVGDAVRLEEADGGR